MMTHFKKRERESKQFSWKKFFKRQSSKRLLSFSLLIPVCTFQSVSRRFQVPRPTDWLTAVLAQKVARTADSVLLWSKFFTYRNSTTNGQSAAATNCRIKWQNFKLKRTQRKHSQSNKSYLLWKERKKLEKLALFTYSIS